MPVLKVLLNKKGQVVGTARTDIRPSGKGAPESATLVARADQKVVEVTVDEKVARLDIAGLHATIQSKHMAGARKAAQKSKK